MPKKNAVNLDFKTEGLDKIIKDLVRLQQASNVPTEKIEKVLKDLYRLQDIAKNGTPVTVNSLQTIIGRLSQFGNQMKDSFSTEFIENLNKKIKELTDSITENEKKLQQLKTDKAGYKRSQTVQEKNKAKLTKSTLDSGLFQDMNELESFKNKTAPMKASAKATEAEKAAVDLYNQKLAAAKEYYKELAKIEEKIKAATTNLKNNAKAQTELTDAIEDAKAKMNDLMAPATASGLGKIGSEVDQLSDSLRKAAADSEVTGSGLVTLSNSAITTSTSFGKMAKSLTIYKLAVHGVKKLISSAVQTFKEMDNAITNMAVVTGRSREELWDMTKDFKNLAQQAGSTMTEMADLTTEFVRQGRAMSEAKILAVETAKAAKIAGISVSDSLTYMTSAINGFNLAASDASRVSDIFARVAAVSATDYEQLAVALSKVSAQANQAGMSIEYTTALLAKGIETTQEAPESIGTALKTVIARFRELSDYGSTLEDGMNVNKVEAALKAVGIQLRNESGEFRDLTNVLNELGPKWDDLNTMQRQAIAQAAAGTRQQSRFLAIMQDWERTMELVDNAQDSAGASAAQYAKYAEGLTATLTNLKTTWQEFTTKLVNSEMVVNFLQDLNDILNSFSAMMSSGFLQTTLVVVTSILGTVKLTQLYESYRVQQAERIQKIMQGESYHQELINAQVKMSTEEYRKYADERYKAHLQEIANEKQIIETKKQKERQTLQDLHTEQRKTIELEYQAKLTAAMARKASEQEIAKLKSEKHRALQENIRQQRQEYVNIDKKYELEIKALDNYGETLEKFHKEAQQSIGFGDQTGVRGLINGLKKAFVNFGKQIKINGGGLKGFCVTGVKGIKQLASTTEAKMAGIAAGIAAVIYLFKTMSDLIQESSKKSQDFINDINSIYGEIGSLYSENNSLEEAIEEYSVLENKINKTAQEQERLNELSKAFADGDYGEGITDIDSARNKYGQNDAEIEKKYDEILSTAMRAAAKEGAKVLDESEFLVSLKEIAKREITIKVTDEKTRKAKEVTSAALENYDFESAYGNISKEWAKANTGAFQGFDWKAALTDFGTMAGGGALAGASIGGPWGALIGGIIGSVAATGTIIYRQTNTYKNEVAKTMAGEMERMIAKTTQEVQKFALAYGETAEESLEEQYRNFAKLMESSDYTDTAKQLVSATEKGFSDLMDLGFTPERIKKLKGEVNTITDSTFKAFIDLASEYGKDGAKAFYNVWEDLVDYYEGDALKVSADLYRVINGVASKAELEGANISEFDADKYSKAAVDKAQEEADKALEDYTNIVKGVNSEGKKLSNDEKRELAQLYGLDATKIKDDDFMDKLREKAKAAYDVEAAEATNLSSTFKKISEAALNTISTFATFNDLSQGLTGLRSVFDNISSFREELENGTISLENLNTVATEYADVFGSEEVKQAIASGDFNQIADLLGGVSTVSDMVSKQREMVNDFIARQNAELDVAISNLDKNDEDYEEQVKALQENTQAQINAAELYAKMYYQITGTQQIQRDRKYAERAWQKGIDNGDISAYANRYNTSLDILKDYEKDYTDFKYDEANNLKVVAGDVETTFDEIYDNILDGDWNLYNALSDTDKEMFYSYLSTLDEKEQAFYDYTQESAGYYEEYQDRIVESQNEAIEIYKDNLKKETDELKKQIDKRKEYYEKFYDALEQEDETQDYENERQRLLNTISRLSTSRDANSLARLKEAQAELAELEKEQRQSERESRKENTMDLLDEYSNEVDNAYEKAIEDNAKIWEMFSEEGSDTMVEMLRKWARATDGYDKMTEEQQAQWDRDFNKKAVNWGYSTDISSPDTTPTPSEQELSSQGAEDQTKVTEKSTTQPDGGKTVVSNVSNSTITDSYNNVTYNITQTFPNITSSDGLMEALQDIQRLKGVTYNAKP